MTVVDISRPPLPDPVLAVRLAHVEFAVASVGDQVDALDVRKGRSPRFDVLRNDDIEFGFSEIDLLVSGKAAVAYPSGQQLTNLEIVLERLPRTYRIRSL